MAYREFAPSAAIRHHVEAYWINRRDADDAAAIDRVLPDGCIDLVFRGGTDGGRLFSSALIERPSHFTSSTSAWFVGVRFRPAMARGVLDLDPVACRDRDIPARAIATEFGVLEAELQEAASPETALATLKCAVDARLAQSARHAAPARVQEALRLLARGGDALTRGGDALARGGDGALVRNVARHVGIAERSLQRDLRRWTGLAPKSLARILRMQRTLAAIRASTVPLAEIALQLGYADQAHMTRELKALAGYRPSELVRRAQNRNGVRNLQDAA